jgi:methionine-S-sulfoxide reductase
MKYLFLIITLLLSSCDSGTETTQHTETAVLSSGCFWGVQHLFREVPGVISTCSGFTGGTEVNPTYYSAKKSGHVEAVEITFNPKIISYKALLKIFFENTAPKIIKREGPLKGVNFRGRIFTTNETQKKLTQELVASYDLPLNSLTEIKEVNAFYPAEELHQDWYFKRGKAPAQTCQIKP